MGGLDGKGAVQRRPGRRAAFPRASTIEHPPARPGGAAPANRTTAVLDLPTLVVFPALMAFAATSDILTMTIANRVSVLLVLAYLGLAWAAGMPMGEMLIDHASCGAAVLVLCFALFAFGWIGGGDAKLAAATAVWLGWSQLADYGLLASMLGAGLTLGLLQFRRLTLPGTLGRQPWLARLHDKGNGVPYGVALAAAGLVLYPQTELWRLVAGA